MSSSSQDTTSTKPNDCDVQAKSRECTYLWIINDYSTISKEHGGKLRSEKFSATDDEFNWRLEHITSIEDDEVFVSFYLRPDCYDELRYCESISGNAVFYVRRECRVTHNPDIGDIDSRFVSRKSSFTFTCDQREPNCKLFRRNKYYLKEYSQGRELSIFFNLTYIKKNEIATISSSKNSKSARMSEIKLSIDLGKGLNDDHFKDVTISVKDKQYRAHKTILAFRSSVFDKMFKVDMSESTNNCIHITDIEPETFEEMLYYIYTGKVRNLDKIAFELLQAADKYDLKELKSMCEDVFIETLSTDNVAKFLMYADTYRAEKLKAHTLRFIKDNYDSCEDFNDDKYWKDLVAGNYRLTKEMVAAFCKKQKMN